MLDVTGQRPLSACLAGSCTLCPPAAFAPLPRPMGGCLYRLHSTATNASGPIGSSGAQVGGTLQPSKKQPRALILHFASGRVVQISPSYHREHCGCNNAHILASWRHGVQKDPMPASGESVPAPHMQSNVGTHVWAQISAHLVGEVEFGRVMRTALSPTAPRQVSRRIASCLNLNIKYKQAGCK
jgi:hypothetical protein